MTSNAQNQGVIFFAVLGISGAFLAVCVSFFAFSFVRRLIFPMCGRLWFQLGLYGTRRDRINGIN